MSAMFGERCHEAASQRHVSEPKVRISWCSKPVGHKGAHRYDRDTQIVADQDAATGATS